MAQSALNVAVVATADSGHMNPMMLLAEGMAKRGHKIQVFTFAFGAGKYERKVQAFGGEFIGLPCEHTEEELFGIATRTKKVPMLPMRDVMKPALLEALRGRTIDILLADFAALAGMELADEMRIPLVINLPGPQELGQNILGALDLKAMVSFGGIHVCVTPFNIPALGAMFNAAGLKEFCGTIRKHANTSLVLVNSFVGIEPPQPLPPHVMLTGPLTGENKLQPLADTHPELHAFIADAVKNGIKVVYITTGSMVHLRQWMVQMLFNAMKLVGCKVIWSLKEDAQEFLPSRDDPNFFISPWLPQPALLNSDSLNAVVTHCGWGGALECIEGAKPVIALPFFGDQPANAKLLVAAGAAELMGPLPPFAVDPSSENYKTGSIKVEVAAASVRRVLDDDRYLAAARRLKKLSKTYGLGCEAACIRIEYAARDGIEHLIHPMLDRASGHRPALVTCVVVAFVGAVIAVAASCLK